MKHLKKLMLTFPYFDRVADSLVVHDNGVRYNRLLATRGSDYLLVYNHSGRDMKLDLSRISGKEKSLWWFNPSNGDLHYIGKQPDGVISLESPAPKGEDFVLIATDSSSSYLHPYSTSLSPHQTSQNNQDLTE